MKVDGLNLICVRPHPSLRAPLDTLAEQFSEMPRSARHATLHTHNRVFPYFPHTLCRGDRRFQCLHVGITVGRLQDRVLHTCPGGGLKQREWPQEAPKVGSSASQEIENRGGTTSEYGVLEALERELDTSAQSLDSLLFIGLFLHYCSCS
jgi:hypothetical protein